MVILRGCLCLIVGLALLIYFASVCIGQSGNLYNYREQFPTLPENIESFEALNPFLDDLLRFLQTQTDKFTDFPLAQSQEITYTSTAVDTTDTVAHQLPFTPNRFIVIDLDTSAVIYKSRDFDEDNIYMKSSIAGSTAKLLIFSVEVN